MNKPRAVIIGGGGTGCATAYDLALRGCAVTLVEQGELTSGTTGRHHGQLHSGARYAVGDAAIGRACYQESVILRRIAAESIEYNGGLFVAVTEEEAEYGPAFVAACEAAGIPAKVVGDPLQLEPALNPRARTAVLVPDGTIDAYRLAMQFAATAGSLGVVFRRFCEAEAIESAPGGSVRVRVVDRIAGGEDLIEADAVVNAGGPWAGRVASLAGCRLDLTPTAGTMVAVKGRLTDMVISRLAPPADGDILVPQRGLSIIGTTSWVESDPGRSEARDKDLSLMIARGSEMVPNFGAAPVHAAWAACRPLYGRSDSSGRELSREFLCVDHGEEGLPWFFSVVGGKATTLRAMAELTADRVGDYLGLMTGCATADKTLRSWRDFFR